MRITVAFFVLLAIAACASTPEQESIEGRYEYEAGVPLVLALRPADGELFAVINGARYPLRRAGADVFLNSSGTEVHIVRDESGRVLGYRIRENPDLGANPLRRMLDASARVPAASWRARPPGAPERYTYRAPREANDGLRVRGLAAEDSLRAGLSALTQAAYDEELPNLDSVLIYRDGALVFEEYFHEYGADVRHQMRSATKTLMALLAGAALERGAIASLDAPVLPYFADQGAIANVDERKRAITIRNLLTMQSGFACNDWDPSSPGNETRMGQTDDWARFILDLPMEHAPGAHGSYCSGNVILAGRIIERVTGRPLREFADEVLFAPLGIEDYEWDFRPDRSNSENSSRPGCGRAT
jgi:CubicO group peptidase (beta-lactamase class C family)